MNLYLIRHGECLGQSDPKYYPDPDSPLSSLGKQQAQLIARYFSQVKLDQIVSIPLIRALETATPMAELLQLPIVVWSDLREGFSNYHQGYSLPKLQKKFPNAQFPNEINEQGWQHGNDVYDDWEPRCERVLKKIISYPEDSHIALISHGGFGNYLLHSVLGLGFKKPVWFELANGSISQIRFVPNPEKERPDWPLYPPVRVEIHAINAVAHLILGIE